MNRALGLMFAAAVAGSAGVAGVGCGDDLEAPALTPGQLSGRLRQLPGVTVQETPTDQPGFHYYILHFTQPIDHDDPSLGTFQQEVSLLHRDERAAVPMIIQTSGYNDFVHDQPVELTRLLAANQVSIEHRYFGTSRPPKPRDWTKLTIKQMAADEHAVIEAMHSIYQGAFLSSGGSKGGMTAVFHRRFYPADVDGTVAYVAPISFGAPDVRYAPFLDTLGPVSCREAVRAAAVRMLSSRRDAMCSHAEGQTHLYKRVLLGPAVEAAIVSLEWTFWQYAGVTRCPDVPGPDATDDQLFAFLDDVSPVSDSDDEKLEAFEAYYYQSYAELGYPDYGAAYLAPFLRFGDEDYAGELPVDEPEYNKEVMKDIDDWVEDHGYRLLFIYGQWDPWTKGKFPLGDAVDSHVLIAPEGTHMTRIANLDLADRELALSKLEAWTGATPMLSRLQLPAADSERKALRSTRMPPALARALTLRK